jgi:hypothetical protein
MSLPGGSSDKFGNRYETWWTALQLERILQGELESIRIEDPGVEKAEFVVSKGAFREFHQAKRSAPNGKWSLSDLASQSNGILQSIGQTLTDRSLRFVFVSSSDARELAELAERAASAESAEEFETVFTAAQEQTENLSRLQRSWDNCDIPTAYDRLRRIEVRVLDERTLADQVHLAAQALFLASPLSVSSALRSIVLDSVHKTVSRPELIDLLGKQGLHLRRLAKLEHAGPAVSNITSLYLSGLRSRLIGGVLIPRAATGQLLAKLGNVATDSVLTGRAGVGKTGCVVEFVGELVDRNVPVLAFRLDRVDPVSTTVELGEKLGLDESPALVLAAAAENREAVLVIDQLDAISTTSGRTTGFFDTVEALLNEVRGLRPRSQIHVIVVCREFDWKNDHRLRKLLSVQHDHVPVTELSIEDVASALSRSGYVASALQPRQLNLLRLPQNLSLFLEGKYDSTPSFSSALDLFDRYWSEKRKAVAARAYPSADRWLEVMKAMVDGMTASQQLSVPRETLDQIPEDYVEQLISEGVVARDGKRFGFGHESFFDYCFARLFSGQNVGIVSFLLETEQHLFRRAQVRQVLEYLREADLPRFCSEFEEFLRHPEIRIHLKDLALAVGANVIRVSDQEWALWESLVAPVLEAFKTAAPNSDVLSRLAWRHFAFSSSFFQYAIEHRTVEQWLQSDSDSLVDQAMSYLRIHQGRASGEIAGLLERYIGRSERWKSRLKWFMELADLNGNRAFFDLFLRLIDDGTLDEARGPIAQNSTFWNLVYGLGENKPERVPEVLGHWLLRRLAVAKQRPVTEVSQDNFFGNDSFADTPITKGAENAPLVYVQQVLPAILAIVDWAIEPGEEAPRQDRMWPYLITLDHAEQARDASLHQLMNAFAMVAKDPDTDLTTAIGMLRSRDANTANVLLLTLYAAGEGRFAEEAAQLLCDQPWRFDSGMGTSSYWFAMKAISAIAPFCSRPTLDRLETTILAYSAPVEKTTYGYKYAGNARFNLLSSFPADLRSDRARRVFRELERKFVAPDGEPKGPQVGFVRSPISGEKIEKLSDEHILRAIERYSSSWRITSAEDFLKGGAEQLAQTLYGLAAKEPRRFAQIYLKIPAGSNPVYTREIMRALASENLEDSLKFEVCEKAYLEDRVSYAMPISEVIGTAEGRIPDASVQMLIWLATEHPESIKELWREDAGKGKSYFEGEIYTSGMNTARGSAALAIGKLIVRDASHIPRFEEALALMVENKSASVQSCIAYALRAVGIHDFPLALTLFLRVTLADEQLLHSTHVYEFIRVGLGKEFQAFRPYIEKALRSARPECAKAGAQLAAIAALRHEAAKDLVEEAIAGSDAQRAAAANVASSNLAVETSREWCFRCLMTFFEDKSAEVRRAAAICFRKIEGQPLEPYGELISVFCKSQAFREGYQSLFYSLERSVERLPGTVCTACETLLGLFGREASDFTSGRTADGFNLSKLIFRVYHQHERDEWGARALNVIDLLCLNGSGEVTVQLGEFDR